MANDGHYYSTPNAPKAKGKGTPAGVAATTPRSLSNYPTSLRTSLYANNSPATAAAGTYSSRVPLVAQLHAPTATAPPSPRASLTTRVHAQAGRVPSRSTSSTATTTTRRKPRTSNPFEELSAPAFDSFIDTITSTLRAVLEPPAPPSTSSEERKRRERERQERERLREVARLEREQRKRGEDVFGQVVAVGDAAASAAAAGQEVDDDEEEDGRVEVEGEPARLSNPTASSVNKPVSPVDSEVIVLDSSSDADDGDHEEEGERGSGGEEEDQLGGYDKEEDDVRGQARTGRNDNHGRDDGRACDRTDNESFARAEQGEEEEQEEREDEATSALLEMRQVDLGVGTRTPLFLQRGTASVSTSEADAEELFQRFDENDEDGGAREQDERLDKDEDEIEGEDQQEEEEEVAGFAARSLYSTTEEEAAVVVDQSDTLLEAIVGQGGEDIYDVDALGEGIEEEEKSLAASQQHEQGEQPASGSMSPVVVVANTESRDASPIEMDRREPEQDDDDDDDDDDDPSVFTDPFGRPVRYDYGFAEEQAGGASEEYEDYVEYEEREEVEEEEGEETSQVDERDPFQQQRRQEEEEEERDLLRRGDGVGSGDEEEEEAGDGGNAMDPAEAEWAGRPTPARPQPRSGSGSPAASGPAPAPSAATAAAAQEKGTDGSASPPPRYAERTPAVEVLELNSSDSEAEGEAGKVDGDAGARAEEEDAETEEAEEEEEEPGTSLTAQMLGDSEPELAVESTSAAEQQQEEEQLAGGEALIDVVEANDFEIGVDNPEEPMDLSNAPPTPAAVSFEPEPSAETPPVAAAADAEPTFVAEADADQSMELGLGSTATTPALQTPAAVPDAADSYFGPSGEAEDREAVESGALADVDEDVVMQEQQPEPTSAPLSQAADAAVDLAEEVEITSAPTPPHQVALPLQGPAAVPAASTTAEAGVKAFEVDEANLADVEEGGDVGAEAVIENEAVHQVQPQPDSEADSLVVTAIEGPTQSEDVSMQQSGGEASRSPDAQAGESAEGAGSRTNPLEALYEHEDSEVSTSRIPYEAKGKGRAPMTPSDFDFDGEADAVAAEEGFGDVGSSSDSTESDNDIVDRIAFAISQWHSVSDQLRFYDRDELVEKLIELRAQYEHANKTESPWEMFIRIQLHDVETEYERREAAGLDDSGSGDDLVEADARREEGSEIRSQAGGDEDEGSSDAERHALFLDEEYEPEGEGSDAEQMQDDSGSPRPVDRSAFPDSPSPSGQDTALSAEQVAAEARLAAIADELIDMHGSDPNSELRVSSSALEAVDSPAGSQPPPYQHSLYALDQPAHNLDTETLDSMHYPPPTSTSQAVEASGITTLTFDPDSEPPLEPHRPFLRTSDRPSQVQHAGNIEYELAPPPRSSSPPRFPPVPTEHRVDSPVTEDGDEPGAEREASEGLIRVGVDEEEMADSTFVGRNLPLRGAIDASREDLHKQADLESTPAASQALVVIDDDQEAEEPSEPSPKPAAPPIASSPQRSPRKRIGATPPRTSEAEQTTAPIVDGVAPPVNYDILPEAPVREERTPEPPVSASTASRDDAKQPAEAPIPQDAGQTRSLKSSEETATLPSVQLNRESAAQEVTTDSRIPFQLPPTIHRPDSPIDEDELSEDSDVVRVGVTAEEESDARLVEEAKPLASAVDVNHTSLHEQDDFSTVSTGGDASSAALTIVDDDADANTTTAFDEAVEASAAVLDSVQATQTSHDTSDAPSGHDSRIEEATSFPYGVAPPLNPDLVPEPTSPPSTEMDDTFNVADFVALGSDDEEDESDAPSSAALPITGTLQAEQLPKTDSDAPQARSVLGLPPGDDVATVEASLAMAVESEDDDREAEVDGGDKSEHALDAKPEQELDGAEGQDRSSPLHVSGVQEPGEWDPSSPIRFGQVEHVERDGSADAEAEPALAFEEQQTSVVQVVIEVDTDGEGVQPTNVESARGSSVATEGLLDEHGNRDPFADVDVISAHSPEPDAESHVADLERNNELDLPQAPSSADDAKAIDAIDFAAEVSPQATESQPQEGASERPDMPVADDIVYTDSDSDDDDEVLALLSPRKRAPVAPPGPSKAAKVTRRTRVEAVAQDKSAESSSPAVRRSSRLSTTPAATPAPPTRQASTSKRTRAEPSTPQTTTSPAKRPRQSKTVKMAGADEVAPLGVRQHRHRHHLPEVHGSDTDDGISPPVTRSHCHFERFKIASQADPQAAPYLFNIPACALSSELARHTIKTFNAEDLGPVDETDGCEGIQLGGVNPNDADAIEVMASRHSTLVPHEDVLDAVRRIAGPELWDDGACEVVPQEEAKRTTRKGKRRAPEDVSQESAKKRR